MYDSKKIGAICKAHRELLGLTQKDVGKDTGYCQRNISAFENGHNDNGIIMLWYIEHGLHGIDIVRGSKNGN